MTEPTFPNLTVEHLIAVEACRDAARRYSYGVDRLDSVAMRSAYWPEAIDEHGSFNGNAHDFVEHCMQGHTRWAWTMHSIYNHRVELDADPYARGEVYNVTHLFRKDEPILDTWYGRYLDRYERRGDEWKIIHRVCVHHGDVATEVRDGMPIMTDAFRQASFDRPADGRPIGP